MEKRRNSELQRLADEERARGDQYAEEAMKERARGDQLAEEALKERERGDQLAQQALSEKQRADEAARVADSLRAEALRHQEEARKQLDKLQSKLIQVTKDARGIILSMSDILFETNKADLTQDLQNNLAKIAGILTVYGESRITVEGHTDNKGTAEYNQGLSERRAENVRAFLVKSGIDEGRLSAVGYGMTRPVADNSTAEGRQKNRRVDLVIADPALDAK
ncbi:MAG: OmpA family protein [Fibrobacterales bacterium]|nr:OmpA family protein [Fibrobacterales bacterium]MBP5188165.1 OmpA family protein [Fibrobacterales bacterium]MBP5350365.1 OmpA family protein [Fibrobacterales bacterium]